MEKRDSRGKKFESNYSCKWIILVSLVSKILIINGILWEKRKEKKRKKKFERGESCSDESIINSPI